MSLPWNQVRHTRNHVKYNLQMQRCHCSSCACMDVICRLVARLQTVSLHHDGRELMKSSVRIQPFHTACLQVQRCSHVVPCLLQCRPCAAQQPRAARASGPCHRLCIGTFNVAGVAGLATPSSITVTALRARAAAAAALIGKLKLAVVAAVNSIHCVPCLMAAAAAAVSADAHARMEFLHHRQTFSSCINIWPFLCHV